MKKFYVFTFIFVMSFFMFSSDLFADNETQNPKNDFKELEYSTMSDPSLIGSGSYKKYFENSYWFEREAGISLSIKPSSYLINGTILDAHKAFDVLKDVHGNDPEWDNTESMKKQFLCHYSLAKLKERWNLEPWKTSTNWIKYPQCN